MLLALILIYCAQCVTHANALATFPSTDLTLRALPDSSPFSCVCPANERSLFDILRSCLATIFACTWVSMHPNIPRPDATQWKITRHRLHLMFWALVAPELIVLWAMRQWHGARTLARELTDLGWTKTHGYFAQMGGFMIFEPGNRLGVLPPGELRRLLKHGHFLFNNKEIPRTDVQFLLPKEEEILDRSKGDGLSKALVVVQTAWFVAQCISRWAQGLIVTELELVTLAFAAFNGVIYFLWWNKPLDVRFAVPVHILKRDQDIGENMIPQGERHLSLCFCSVPVAQSLVVPGDPDGINTGGPHLLGNGTAIPLDGVQVIAMSTETPQRISHIFRAIIRGDFKPAISLFQFSMWKLIPERIEKLRTTFIFSPQAGAMEVSPLYGYVTSLTGNFSIIAATFIIAMAFGGIHCAGWAFLFPSRTEGIIWRVCASAITGIPLVLLGRSLARYLGERNHRGPWADPGDVGPGVVFWVIVILAPVYFLARLGLLVEAFAALRDLQPGARAQVQWIDFLPHI